ncbi:hypothetical protein Rctr71_004 [Virus Rctr71]|nr:hypothetical protein Rctr71_004 [Virus Rctr71]
MKIPGFIYTAVLVGLYALLESLRVGLEVNIDAYWVPVAISAIAAAAKWVQVQLEDIGSVDSLMTRSFTRSSMVRRFFLE